ncbi:hypothetical protein DU31_12990 [Methanosarcina mazei]|uniref:Uncharacterized protein n=1 Tax=Methanosarcina mazei TaxID=2209 RepID=A0A0F8E5C5_METMZ|nr:hypothetical protein DU31_12990 [Methanosarcina mazei]
MRLLQLFMLITGLWRFQMMTPRLLLNLLQNLRPRQILSRLSNQIPNRLLSQIPFQTCLLYTSDAADE